MAGQDGLPTTGRHLGIGCWTEVDVPTHRRDPGGLDVSGRGLVRPIVGLVLVGSSHRQPMACSTRNPERNRVMPMAVAVATPPTTTKAVSRSTERTRCHQRMWARWPVSTRRGGWYQTPRRALGLQDRSIAYSTSPDGGRRALPARWMSPPGSRPVGMKPAGRRNPTGRRNPAGPTVGSSRTGRPGRVPDPVPTMAGWKAPGGDRRDNP